MKYYIVFGIFIASLVLTYVAYFMGYNTMTRIFAAWMFGAAVDYCVMLMTERKEDSEKGL